MKDFNSLLEQDVNPIPLHSKNFQPIEIRDRTWWDEVKDQIIRIGAPFVLAVFTGPFNTASILLQTSDKPDINAFAKKIEIAGESAKMVRTGVFGDNKIFRPFALSGYNECLTQLGKEGLRGMYKGNLTGIILGALNAKMRSQFYEQGNKVANFSEQWKSNILTILTCTAADLITQPILFCQTRLIFQNSLAYTGARDVLKKTSAKQWIGGCSLLLFKNILFAYSWMTIFKNSPIQSFVASTLLSHMLTYPFMTVIRQLQTNNIGVPMMNQREQKIRDCLKRIWRDQGVRGFYRGFAGYGLVHTFLGFIMVQMNMRSGYFTEMG